MDSATLRFHGTLRDLVRGRGREPFVRTLGAGRSVKDAIESAGVPHTEVDLILISDRPVGFAYVLDSGDRAEVYGIDRPGDLAVSADLPGLLPGPPAPIRFVLDGHLGTLTRYLRMLGFDSAYRRDAGDGELARLSADERRVLLSRDRGLLKRSIVAFGHLIRDDDPRAQLVEVADRYALRPLARPFTRCVRCSGQIEAVPRDDVLDELAGEPRTLRYFDSFGRCRDCRSIYWKGSHFDRMSRLIEGLLFESDPTALTEPARPPDEGW